ncbi:hypothetical protein [Parerythrobacter aestuarii]|uniref:hypothetical protein n=1 Tax=Parerythrobacter aestuarii TaxID=3020909 RepID=UPI0024DE227A|nr:hypothetical protein [Parerythrobacter aestuarii]
MRRPLALGITALVAVCGTALLAPPALPLPPVAAASLGTSDSQLQLRGAQAALTAQTPTANSQAAELARKSIAAMPLNQPALAVLVESRQAAAPTRAANVAAALGWRDPLANARILQLALNEGNVVVAAQRVDALGRTQGGEVAAPSADLLMTKPGGPEALAARASNRSGGLWWITYLRLPAASPDAESGRLAFARLLDSDDGPWRRQIVTALVGSLEGGAAAATGDALWRDTLADPQGFGTVLYDEAFARLQPGEVPVGGEWRIAPRAPYAVERVGEGVVLSRLGQGTGSILIQRFEPITGRYRLAATGEGEATGLGWQVQCKGRGIVFSSDGLLGEWPVIIPEGCSEATIALVAERSGASNGSHHLARVSLERLQ